MTLEPKATSSRGMRNSAITRAGTHCPVDGQRAARQPDLHRARLMAAWATDDGGAPAQPFGFSAHVTVELGGRRLHAA
jgi:hypothetical protein